MNIKSIKAVSIWLSGARQYAKFLQLLNFNGYNFDDSDARVVYRLLKSEQQTSPEGKSITVYVTLVEGTLVLPAEIVANWGTDDTPIWSYVMEQLNLTEEA